MNVDTLFESLKNIFGIMDDLVQWGMVVESKFIDYAFDGVCSFGATDNMLAFVNHENDKNIESKLVFGITKSFLSQMLEDGFRIEFGQVYYPTAVKFVFRLAYGDNYLRVKVYDIDYDVAKEALEKITKEIYRIRGIREE